MKLQYFPTLLALLVPVAAQQAALTPNEDTPDVYTVTMPAEPAWRSYVNGQSVVRLSVQVPGAAACKLQFAWLGLAKDEAMYVHAAGDVAHGPYLGHGPVNRPDFESQWLPGHEFAITATGRATADFPFILHSVKCQTAEQLAAAPIRFRKDFVPSRGVTGGEQVTAMVEEQLVLATRHEGTTVLQGDIVLPEDVPAAGKNAKRESMQAAGGTRAWRNFRIPYKNAIPKWDGEFIDQQYLDVESAVEYWNELFPGLLVPVQYDADYVSIRPASGVCQSAVGRSGGMQKIEIDRSCGEVAIIHELGHAIGLWHEQSRQDRDTFVKINWDNITTGKEHNFNMVGLLNGKDYGSYDYGSIMHYGAFAFSNNGKRTIEPLQAMPAGVTMGMANSASAGDIASVRNLICKVWYVPPASLVLDGDADTYNIQIVVPPYCSWTASETSSWLSMNKTSGTGPATIQLTAAFNNLGGKRQTTINLNGRTVTVTQNKFE